MLCYALAKHARFCKPGIVTFSKRYIKFFLSENWSKTIEGKLAGFLSVKEVDLIQSNLKPVAIFSYY